MNAKSNIKQYELYSIKTLDQIHSAKLYTDNTIPGNALFCLNILSQTGIEIHEPRFYHGTGAATSRLLGAESILNRRLTSIGIPIREIITINYTLMW